VEDDAHKTVYSDMLPLARKYNVPVTVFVYPSAISNAKVRHDLGPAAGTEEDRVCSISQSHTYWHPNFKKERKKLKPAELDKLVDTQLKKIKG